MLKLNQTVFYHCLLSLRPFWQLLGRIPHLLGRVYSRSTQAIAVYGLQCLAYNVVLSLHPDWRTLSGLRIASSLSGFGRGQVHHSVDLNSLSSSALGCCLLAVPFMFCRDFLPRRYWEIPKPQQHFY